jgi:hypothetical protein
VSIGGLAFREVLFSILKKISFQLIADSNKEGLVSEGIGLYRVEVPSIGHDGSYGIPAGCDGPAGDKVVLVVRNHANEVEVVKVSVANTASRLISRPVGTVVTVDSTLKAMSVSSNIELLALDEATI